MPGLPDCTVFPLHIITNSTVPVLGTRRQVTTIKCHLKLGVEVIFLPHEVLILSLPLLQLSCQLSSLFPEHIQLLGLGCLDLEKVVVMGSGVKGAPGCQSQGESLPVPGRQGEK